MADPVVAQKAPFGVEVEEGKSYWWCACGLSKEQPFCDGSHNGTGIEPSKYSAEKSGTVYFCGCKNTNVVPVCDGTHAKL